MAKTKKRRSKAQRAATARMLAANKAKRSGRKQKRHGKRRARRAAKHSGTRRSSKRRRRAAKAAAPIIRRVYIKAARKGKRARKIKLQIRRVKATKRRGRRKARGSLLRTIALNPALSISAFIAPIKNVVANLKASLTSATGIASVAGGAIGAVAGGTLMARVTMPLALRFFPTFAASPMGARALAVFNYYGAGYLLARFLPVNERIKRGILAGAVVASVVEVIRPGSVQMIVAKVPVVGPMIAGNLGGIEPELGAYIETALNGLGLSTNESGALSGYELGAYERSLGAYEMDGLGCTPSAQELVSYDG